MTQKEKQLLLQDLCARLPYGVKIRIRNDYVRFQIEEHELCAEHLANVSYNIENLSMRPYLRPMSSMTEDKLFEIQEILGKGVEIHDVFISIVDSSRNTFSYLELQAVFEWFLKNHFDFMGLIPKGLAIAVTKENNPYKE